MSLGGSVCDKEGWIWPWRVKGRDEYQRSRTWGGGHEAGAARRLLEFKRRRNERQGWVYVDVTLA